jgi:hypothetical protein
MPFNVDRFNSELTKTGLAMPSHFEAIITRGPAGRILPEVDQGMRFRIESVNIPGRTLTALDQQYNGPVRSIPYRFTVPPISFTVILSRDMREREAFMKWQDYLIGHSRTNYNGAQQPGMYDSKYYDNGIGEIEIWQYSQPTPQRNPTTSPLNTTNQTGSQTPNSQLGTPGLSMQQTPDAIVQNQFRFLEAYPLSVNDIAMSWNDEGYSKLQVEIKYRTMIEINKSFQNDTDFRVDVMNAGR